ncbi:MAG: hypothetical protein ABIC91_00805 [Nanoarchaeota archaeon]|nr:hypothetical protein [Nanoarchaeota archaeon]MBU1029911.1 hypothetical protein [Nanoarchaeota archaeon]MBU1850401.1 hypothetical protein [Nanoarchaeota archaeon]
MTEQTLTNIIDGKIETLKNDAENTIGMIKAWQGNIFYEITKMLKEKKGKVDYSALQEEEIKNAAEAIIESAYSLENANNPLHGIVNKTDNAFIDSMITNTFLPDKSKLLSALGKKGFVNVYDLTISEKTDSLKEQSISTILSGLKIDANPDIYTNYLMQTYNVMPNEVNVPTMKAGVKNFMEYHLYGKLNKDVIKKNAAPEKPTSNLTLPGTSGYEEILRRL